MNESSENNNFRPAGKWLKEVLSKSGTELMEITTPKTTVAKNDSKQSSKSNKKNDSAAKMVYYQSTPLIIKTENPSQTQFCTPLQTAPNSLASSATSAQQTPISSNYNKYSFIGNNEVVMQKLQQDKATAPSQTITIAQLQNLNTVPNQMLLTNIKAEILTSNNETHYAAANKATTTTISQVATTSSNSNAKISTIPITPSTSALTLTATTVTGRRKPAANKVQFKCEQCGMMFGSKSAHTSHTKSHIKNGELTLNMGPNRANSSSGQQLSDIIDASAVPLGIPQIRANANGTASGEPYECNVCQKTFAVPARLIRHYRTHTGERPFECEFCHKLFSVKENLQVHRRIHTKERPYKCDVCGRAFEHSGKLHRHMRIHTGERPHKCSVCEKTFIQSGQLVIHMRTHTGEKPYKCPVEGCGKGFTCSKQLKVHSRTHTGEKPYHCDICFRDFGYNHVLKLHRVQHYGSKCYKCTICDETFKSKKEMEAHIKGHANELPDDDDENPRPSSSKQAGASTTSSGSSGGETTSAPDSPISSIDIGKPKKRRVERKNLPCTVVSKQLNVSPSASSSPMPSLSPSSPATSASIFASRLSPISSPASSVNSPEMTLTHETDYYSHDSGELTKNNGAGSNSQTSATTSPFKSHNNHTSVYSVEEMPTDLSIQPEQQKTATTKYYQSQQQSNVAYMQPQAEQQQQSLPQQQQHIREQQHLSVQTPSVYGYMSNTSPNHHKNGTAVVETATINPALLEAASIASRSVMLETRELEVTQAALQIMQLNRSQHQHQQHQQQQLLPQKPLHQMHHSTTATTITTANPSTSLNPSHHHSLIVSDISNYDDTTEANELIKHYKRGELARHGIHKGYAPVPKFESSLLNNEIIVRQVEAAIAPLRSSTESPERSSSPESDSMLMADRDIMTLPLRKRKFYMSEGPKEISRDKSSIINDASHSHESSKGNGNGNSNTNGSSNNEIGTRVMRMSSVIQFAKAS